jgi:2-iminobutanoate/2-iminopropanoate deaminase
MNKAIYAENAPAAIGPYVHAVQVGNMVFTSGQLGLIPETGELAEGLEAQTRRAIQNLTAVLAASDMGLEDVVKTTVFVDSMNDFAKINEIYGEYFNDNKPARSCVEVAALPKGALVEIEAIAAK